MKCKLLTVCKMVPRKWSTGVQYIIMIFHGNYNAYSLMSNKACFDISKDKYSKVIRHVMISAWCMDTYSVTYFQWIVLTN